MEDTPEFPEHSNVGTSAEGPTPKRHHTVPEFFLRGFAIDDRVQIVTRAPPSKSFVANVKDALVQKHFYSVDTPTGKRTDVEALLSKIEGKAAWALRRLLDPTGTRFPPLSPVREALSIFFAFQTVRGEWTRRSIVRGWEELARKTAESMTPEIYRQWHLEEYGDAPSDDEVTKMVRFARDSSRYRVKMSDETGLHLRTLLELPLELVPYFERRRWQLLTFEEPVLVTGDEPIAPVHSSLRPGEARLGIATAPTIVIPLDSTRAVVLVRPDLADREERVAGTTAHAEIINLNVAYGCHRCIVHRPGANPLAGVHIPERGAAVTVNGTRAPSPP